MECHLGDTVAVLDVAHALICLDCDALYGETHSSCLRCGSRSWVRLDRWLGSLRTVR